MYAFAVSLFLPIKHRIFILRPHFPFRRHLLFPPLHILHRFNVLLLERTVHHRYNVIDESQSFALTALLGVGEAPWNFPVVRVS